MEALVELRDGIEIVGDSGTRIVADAATPSGDFNVLSHAHGDHLYSTPPSEIVCSETTAALAAARRRDERRPSRVNPPEIELIPSGHIPGSRAAHIDLNGTGVLYTGDVSTRDRFYLDGFNPISADVLIIESTYGKPTYELPPQREVEAKFVDWLNDTMGTPIVVFGYTLGRAQEIQLLAERSDRNDIYVTDAIQRINDLIETQLNVSLEVSVYDDTNELTGEDILVLPSQTRQLAFVDEVVEKTGALTVGVSGWAVTSSFKFRGGYDETFALSDHCGFSELLEIVEEVDPEKVYTQHGFVDELAQEITRRLGYTTQSLKQNQTTLSEF